MMTAAAAAAGNTAGAPSCESGPLMGGKYCDMGLRIGCQGRANASTCQIITSQPQRCSSRGKHVATVAANNYSCALEAATACDATASCVAFSVHNNHRVYEMAHTNPAVLTGFPDR